MPDDDLTPAAFGADHTHRPSVLGFTLAQIAYQQSGRDPGMAICVCAFALAVAAAMAETPREKVDRVLDELWPSAWNGVAQITAKGRA